MWQLIQKKQACTSEPLKRATKKIYWPHKKAATFDPCLQPQKKQARTSEPLERATLET
jgi:hypothetical protein